MKNLKFLLLVSILFINCSQSIFAQIGLESDEINVRISNDQNIPIVKGKVLNYSADLDGELIIKYVSVVPLPHRQETQTTSIDSEGSFQLELNIGLPYQQIWLSIGDYYYGGILANKDLYIEADFAKLRKDPIKYYGNGIEFGGSDAQANLLINQYYNFERPARRDLNRSMRKVKRNRDLSLEEKVKETKRLYDELKAIDEKYIKMTSSHHAWILENERQSDLYGALFVLHWGKEIDSELLEECISHEPMLISNASISYYSYLKTFLAGTDKNKRFDEVKKLLQEKVTNESEMAELNQFLGAYEKRINGEAYDKEIYKSGTSQFMTTYETEVYDIDLDLYLQKAQGLPNRKTSIMKLVGAPEDVWKREQYLEKVIPTISLEWCKKIMVENLELDKGRIAAITNRLKENSKTIKSDGLGENIINLDNGENLFVSNHENVEALIQAIRAKNKGKAVILDIWATWCGPCISDMKGSHEIKKELKNLPVEIVYLCVEDKTNKEKWKNKIAELSISGDHIFLNKYLSAEIMEFFKLSGYPSHVFIDKEGNYDPNFISSISRLDVARLKKKL